jgi:disulfide bond formation protein DsbB
MRPIGFLGGVLLTAAGLLMLLLIAMGIGLTPDGTDALVLGLDIRSFMTIAAGLALAGGITHVGLNVGHWKHPKPQGEKLDEAAITENSWRLK